MANTVSSLQQKILGLTAGRVDIMASNDEFKSTTQILRELAAVWDTMTDIQQAASLEALGGKRQANILASIITNFSTVEDVIATSQGSAGSALEENEKRLDSFQGRLNQLTSTIQTKWSEALDTELIKDAIQLLTKLVNTLDFKDSALIDLLDLLMKGLSGLMDFFGDNNLGYTLIAFFSARSLNKNGILDFFTKIKDTGEETIESLTTDISNLRAENEKLVKKGKRSGVVGKTKANQQIALNNEEIKQKEAKITELQTQKTKENTVANEQNAQSVQQVANAETTENIAAQKDIATTQTDNVVTDQNTISNQQNATSNQQAAIAESTDTAATQANINATQADTVVTQQNTIANQTNANSNVKVGKSAKLAGSGFKSMAAGMLKTIGITLVLQGAFSLIDAITKTIKESTEDTMDTYEELHEHFDVMSSDLSEQKSELQSLESEFDTIQEQIRDIQKLGSLSFTKQEELNNLQKQSAELERQIEMQKIITQNQQLKTNTAALDAATAYLGESAETDKARAEFIEEETEKTTRWTDSIGDVLMGAGAVMAMIPTIGWVAGAITAGVGALTKFGGKLIAENSAENKYDAQQTNKQTIDNYETKRKELQAEMDKAYAEGNTEKWKEAQQKLNDYEGMVAENMGQIQEYISSVDYSTLTEQEKARYEELNRILNKYSLANGGSITNAVGSILDYDKFEQTGYQMDAIQNQLKNGDITSEQATQQIRELLNASPLLREELTNLGLDIEEQVIPSFVQLGEAMRENASLMDSLDKISAVTSAFDDLGNAVQEFRTEGRASTGTLESLNEKFGEIDGFEELYKVLATGEGDLEGAITNVANAYVGQIQALSGLTDEEIEIMKSRLAAIGVLNADEVIMARQKGQQMLEDAGLTYGIDLQNYGTTEQAKVAIATAAGLNIADIGDDEIETMAKQYGVDLTNYATKEEQKIAIAQARAKATAEIDKAELKKKYDNKEIDYSEYMTGVEKIDSSINFSTNKDEIWNIVNNAFKDFTFDFNGQIGIGSDFDEKTGMSDEQSKAWEELLKKYQRELDFLAHQKDLIQAEIDEAEAKGFIASEKYYEDLIALEKDEQAVLIAKQKAMQDFYNANSASMSADQIDEWNSEMRETALAIQEAENNMIEFGNTIEDVKWEYFENVREDIDAINEEIEFMHSLLEDAPVADENGNWSNEALTRLGLYTQQMEEAAYSAQDYQQKIDELNESTTDEEKNSDRYRDKLAELVDGQREAINSYEDAKDGIVELNEARIEAIKEGIEKEIEAMNDLLDVKREELDAERDLYDFKKNIEEQNKSIADTERKLAALSGSTAAEDIAERKRLEAELRKQQGDLDDTYYDHSMTAQQNALDEEGRYFEEAQQRRIESLEAMLENTEELIVNSMMDVMLNADTVHNTLNEQANTYGVTLSKELTQPWLDASAQAIKWRDELKKDMTEGEWATMIGEGGAITAFSNGVATKLGGSWDTAKTKAKAYSDFLTGTELKNNLSGAVTTFTTYLQKIVDKWDEIRKAANAAVSVTPTVPSGGYTGGGSGDNPTPSPSPTTPKKETPKAKSMHADGQLYARTVVPTSLTSTHKTVGGVTYVPIPGTDYYVKKSDAPFGSAPYGTKKYKYYAKGSLGVDKDQWAITDEYGPELMLVPDGTGKLSYLKAGTGIVPADMTQKLFELAQIPTSDLMSKNMTAIVPNITKNEFKNEFNFDSLVHVDHCDQNTLKDLEKMVDNKINQFGKQMNYALKGIK